MRKEDMSVWDLLLEAVILIFAIAYLGLQIFYGITYHIPIQHFLINVLAMILIYLALTTLGFFPERVNKLPEEAFTPDIRKLTLRMIRLVKAVLVTGLLVPCAFDAIGMELQEATSLIVIGAVILIVVYFEGRIIHILRSRRK